MNRTEIEHMLRASLQDGRLSRSEKAAIRAVLEDDATHPHDRDWIRSLAFEIAQSEVLTPDGAAAIRWLDGLMGILLTKERPSEAAKAAATSEACFSPGDACLMRIQRFIRDAKASLDICVFTITDNRITRSIVEAHRQGCRIRVISDNDKSLDLGSDMQEIQQRGIPVVLDRTSDHMHHKFALADGRLLLTGSYNWTRSAATSNQENIVVTGDTQLVSCFKSEFNSLWQELSVS